MSVLLILACLRPTNEATPAPRVSAPEPAPPVQPSPAPPATPEPAPTRAVPAQYASVPCPDGRYAVGGWVSGINQPNLTLETPLSVPMRGDFCDPEPTDRCTLPAQVFALGGYTIMDGLVTTIEVPPGRVQVHWVGEGGCLLWKDGASVLDIENCPDNPPELEWASDISLLPATCSDGRRGWFSEADLFEAGALQTDH